MSTNSNESIITNPNQAEFPITLTAIPVKEDKEKTIATCVTDDVVKVGDEIKHLILGKKDTLIVEEVLESRPAKGDYSGAQYNGTKPTWNKVVCKQGFVTPPMSSEDVMKK